METCWEQKRVMFMSIILTFWLWGMIGMFFSKRLKGEYFYLLGVPEISTIQIKNDFKNI